MDSAHHPALLLVDTISSLGSIDYRHDEWGVDVTIAGSQKGLMLPPGMSFNAISEKALAANAKAGLPRSYWDWQEMLKPNRSGFFPYTPPTNLMYGLREAMRMMKEEGLANIFHRHDRHAEATRVAVRAWGLEIVCENPSEYSSSLTAVFLPAGSDADKLRAVILENFDMSLGAGLSKLAGKVFRIGQLGSFNDLTLAGTLWSGNGLAACRGAIQRGRRNRRTDSLAPRGARTRRILWAAHSLRLLALSRLNATSDQLAARSSACTPISERLATIGIPSAQPSTTSFRQISCKRH